MNGFLRHLKIQLRLIVCATLTATPFYGISPIVVAQEIRSGTELSEVNSLLLDLETLLDRALYPRVPRHGLTGVPTTSEISRIENRLLAVHKSYVANLNRNLQNISQSNGEYELLKEINTYFNAVRRFEGIRIIMGETIAPETWEDTYGLQIELANMSQLRFLAQAGLESSRYVNLPGVQLNIDSADSAGKDTLAFRSRIDMVNGQWLLRLTLQTKFVEEFERMAMISNPSTRNVFLLALHFAAHRMYDSWSVAHMLVHGRIDTLPEPSAPLRAQFASLRLARARVIETDRIALYQSQKLQILRSILKATDDANRRSEGWAVSQKFLGDFRTLTGVEVDAPTAENIFKVARRDESSNFITAVVTLLNLIDLNLKDAPAQTQFIVTTAKRLALRWAFLKNPDEAIQKLSPDASHQLANLIDVQVAQSSIEILKSGQLANELTQTLRFYNEDQLRAVQRTLLQHAVLSTAEKFKTYTTDSINLRYLLGAQSDAIKSMDASAFVQNQIEGIRQHSAYNAAFDFYRGQLFSLIKAYTFKQPLAVPFTLDKVFKATQSAEWNPNALADQMDVKYLGVLNASPSSRLKDLRDLVRLGQLLKFDVYDRLRNTPGYDPNAVNLELEHSWLGAILGSTRTNYFEEMRKDVFFNAPILGGVVEEQSGGFFNSVLAKFKPQVLLYEKLGDPSLDDSTKNALVDSQLKKVEAQILTNNATVNSLLAQLLSHGANDMSGVGEQLGTIVLRASQLVVGLNAAPGFAGYFQNIQNEILQPGFAGREWNDFSSWAENAATITLVLWGAQALIRRTPYGNLAHSLSTLVAPIFGPNFQRINLFLVGVVGVVALRSGYEGYGPETRQRETLQNFFACGSVAPCVALFSDVSNQTKIVDAARGKAIRVALTLGAVFLGLRYGPRIWARLTGTRNLARHDLTDKLEILGLNETSLLSRENLKQATESALAKAGNITNPLTRAVKEIYIRNARRTIEAATWAESKIWYAYETRFARDAEALGLNSRTANWKDPAALNVAYSRLKAMRSAGEVSSFRYLQLIQTISDMKSVLKTTYAGMAVSPFKRNFTERAWDNLWLNSTLPSSEKVIELNHALLRRPEFVEIDERLNSLLSDNLARTSVRGQPEVLSLSQSSRIDALIERMGIELETDPINASTRIETLLKTFRSLEVPQ